MKKIFQNIFAAYRVLMLILLNLCTILSIAQTNKPTADNKVIAVSTSKVYTPADYGSGTLSLVNSVYNYVPQQPYSLESDVISSSRQVSEVIRNMQYMDGLGKPLQNISWRTSPGQKDILSPVVYDAFGR